MRERKINKDKFLQYYYQKTYKEMGKLFKLNPRTLQDYAEKLRANGDIKYKKIKYNIPKSVFLSKYIKEQKSLRQIAQELGISSTTVKNRIESYKIPKRTRGEANSIRLKNKKRFIHKHHLDLNQQNNHKKNIIRLSNRNHQRFHRFAYHYLLEKFGISEIKKYKKWFDKRKRRKK